MYAKLALRNVRKQAGDYAIYFVTLLVGVAVFYAFNSIEAQQVLFDIQSESSASMFNLTVSLLFYFSFAVAAALGFLIVYANRFLIRRRKQEFGAYLMLGMPVSRVTLIVLMETLAVGAVSLLAGLALGFALSQLLSFATAALFGTTISNYRFVFSSSAVTSTLIAFGVIFGIVALFNARTVRHVKLVELIGAQERPERGTLRKPWAAALVFVASIGILAAAYYLLALTGLIMLDGRFVASTLLMLMGTLGLMWSGASFIVLVAQRTQAYRKGLTAFTTRQLASRINSAFVSLWAVAVLLFLAITTFSTGMGMLEIFAGNIADISKFDTTQSALFIYYNRPEDVTPADWARQTEPEHYAAMLAAHHDMLATMKGACPDWSEHVAAAAQADTMQVEGMVYADLIAASGEAIEAADWRNQPVQVMAVSQFNAVRELAGEEPIALAEDEYAPNNNLGLTQQLADALARNHTSIEIAGHTLTAQPQTYAFQTTNGAMKSESCVLIVPDDVVDDLWEAGCLPSWSIVDVMYTGERAEGDAWYTEAFNAYFAEGKQWWPAGSYATGTEMAEQAAGMRLAISYLALYVGLVFLVVTAAILSIQQLTSISDSLPRYNTLAKIGTDPRDIARSVRTQVLLYFAAPLAVALCHSAWAIHVLSGTLLAAFGSDFAGPILLAAALVTIAYGGYALVTQVMARSLVKSAM